MLIEKQVVFYQQMLEVYLRDVVINGEGARYLSFCIHNIEKLSVSNCQIREDAIQLLADGIRKRSLPVKYFVQLVTYERAINI